MPGEVLSARQAFEQRAGVYEHAQFGRVVTAMVTPFGADGELNTHVAQELAMYLVEHSSEGLVLAGTTGESPTLTRPEELDLFEAVRGAVSVPIIAGTGSNNTREAVELTKLVTERGLADGILAVSPYYNKPPQSGIRDYFRRIASSTDLPVVMYNIPGRTGGAGIEPETIAELSTIDNIVGLKDASGQPERTARMVSEGRVPSEFMIYSGDDGLNLQLASGPANSVGAISVASHWAGLEIAAMYDALAKLDFDTAERFDRILRGSYEFETGAETPNPLPAKAMMRLLGIKVGYGRSPMVLRQHENDMLDVEAGTVLRQLELLSPER